MPDRLRPVELVRRPGGTSWPLRQVVALLRKLSMEGERGSTAVGRRCGGRGVRWGRRLAGGRLARERRGRGGRRGRLALRRADPIVPGGRECSSCQPARSDSQLS